MNRSGAPSITVTVHRPERSVSPSPVLVWFYGGGLIAGTAAHVNDVASKFAVDLGAVVVVPDYRVAPEHPYPAAIDDCFVTLKWVIEHADQLDVNPNCILVGGESAGGGLAAAVAQRAHDNGIALRLQVLVSPMLDDRSVIRAERNRERPLAWTVKSNRFGWTAYLGHAPGEAEHRPYAVPARREDVTGVAPAWLAIGTADLFYDESVEYAERLKAAGVPCELIVMAGAHHGAEYLKPAHPKVQQMRDARLAAMRRAITSHT
ncbi:MAG: alpha/beta hydrolase [Acidimicrobiia bacterium]